MSPESCRQWGTRRRDRVDRSRPGDTIASSGPYSYGVAQAIASVTREYYASTKEHDLIAGTLAGHYCVVVSTFEPRHRGKFTLRVDSAMPMDLEDIPAEGAGMFCKTVKGAWCVGA